MADPPPSPLVIEKPPYRGFTPASTDRLGGAAPPSPTGGLERHFFAELSDDSDGDTEPSDARGGGGAKKKAVKPAATLTVKQVREKLDQGAMLVLYHTPETYHSPETFEYGIFPASYEETEYIHRFSVKSYRLACAFRIAVGLELTELWPFKGSSRNGYFRHLNKYESPSGPRRLAVTALISRWTQPPCLYRSDT